MIGKKETIHMYTRVVRYLDQHFPVNSLSTLEQANRDHSACDDLGRRHGDTWQMARPKPKDKILSTNIVTGRGDDLVVDTNNIGQGHKRLQHRYVKQ